MDMQENIWIALAFSFFFSGMEVAYLSANKLRYELDKNSRSLTSWILDLFFRNPNQFIATMLMGNAIALVVLSVQIVIESTDWLTSMWGNPVGVVICQAFCIALVVLFVGEFIPRLLFKMNPNFSLRLFAIPLFFIYILFYPIAKLFAFCSFLLLKLFGVKGVKVSRVYALGKVELDSFIQQSIEEAPQDEEMDTEVKMFQNALDFSNVRLRDCIVPRTEIVACDKQVGIDELRERFIETGLSKILVYNENIDDIVGYIHSSELFKHPTDWTTKIRPVPVVPETMTANKLMRLLMQEKKSLAVVVDEFGGTSGMVTLEDLVEEIFGEIEDEHDVKMHVAKKIADNEYILSGRLEIDSLNEMFDLDLPESDEYVTVAGMILHYYEDFPKPNETVVCGNYSFKIIRATATKIELVRMKVLEADEK